MDSTRMTIFLLVASLSSATLTCPRYCSCDMWKNMRRAACNNKNLYTIEIGVPQLVEVLELSSNSIITIEDNSFQNLGLIHLKILNLDRNHIKHIGMHAFRGLNNLYKLDLSNNHLKYLVHGTFQHTSRLTSLYLRGNEFSGEGTGLVLEVPTLKVLDLSQCHIGYLAANSFLSLQNLTTLILSENELVKLDTVTLEPLKKLKNINILKNPWHCDMNTKELIKFLKTRNITHTPVCNNEEYANQKFGKIMSYSDFYDEKEVLWTDEEPDINPKTQYTTNDSCLEDKKIELPYVFKIFDNIPSFWSFLLGLEIGIMVTVVGMWLWLKVCDTGPKDRTQNMSQPQRSLRVRTDSRSRHHWMELETINCPDTPPPPYRDIGHA